MLNTAEIEAEDEDETIDEEFRQDVKRGLSAQKKSLNCKYLYDTRGSELFVDITGLDEYYLTRCEAEIFQEQSTEIAGAISNKLNKVVELGCGDGIKTEYLLSTLSKKFSELSFIPVDICENSTAIIKNRINNSLPNVKVKPWHGDYFKFLDRPHCHANNQAQLILFLGSNIGNFTHTEARRFLQSINQYCTSGDYLLLGLDLKKDVNVLHAAYNDKDKVTSEFNFNLLERINRELGAEFDTEKFSHHAYYNPHQGAMQSFLVSKESQSVSIDKLDLEVDFDALEAIHIEDSHKYSHKDIELLASETGFEVCESFVDSKEYFVDVLLKKAL